MPSFKSVNGVWEPATEETVVKKVQTDGTIKHELYHGPDREAEKYIKENGGQVGILNSEDPQIIEIAEGRRMTVEQYLVKNAPRPEQVKAKMEADAKVITHSDQAPKEGVQPSLGGFNEDGIAPIEEVEARRRGRPRKV